MTFLRQWQWCCNDIYTKKSKKEDQVSLLKKKKNHCCPSVCETLTFVFFILYGGLWAERSEDELAPVSSMQEVPFVISFPFLFSHPSRNHPTISTFNLIALKRFYTVCRLNLLFIFAVSSASVLWKITPFHTKTSVIFLTGERLSVAMDGSCGSQEFCLQLLVLLSLLGEGENLLL